MSAFETLGICPEIIQAIEEDEWLLPTPVQDDAIPLILGGGDVLAAAETGSGKTGAFGLPCLQIVHETLRGKCVARAGDASNLKCELNLSDKDMFVLVTEDGLDCKSEDQMKWNGIRATIEVYSGAYMYEVMIVEGLCRVGWGAPYAKLEIGTDEKSFGYGGTGKKAWNRKFEDYGEPFEPGDVIGCCIDREKGIISYYKNGKDLGKAFDIPSDLLSLKPQICGKGFNVECRFDEMEFPVEGYTPIGEIDPKDTPQGMSQARGKRPLLCMILEPTRDLAEQTYKCMTRFSKYLTNPGVKIALFVGGVDEKEQARALNEGVDICVGTLQKTLDHMRNGRLDVSQVKFLVLDEADDLQKKDDRNTIPRLNQQIKRGRKDRVQTLFFSATLHTQEVQKMIAEITTRPIWVDLKGKDSVPDTVHHVIYKIDPNLALNHYHNSANPFAVHCRSKTAVCVPTDEVHMKQSMSGIDSKFPRALELSEKIKIQKFKMVARIADAFKMNQCLVFCRTNVDCNILEKFLNTLGGNPNGWRGKAETGKENPYSCVVLAGMRDQDERRLNLAAFKEGDIRFLICTDVAARGIDIAGLPYLIMVTLPDDIENYIHRVGRVGRAERVGLAISLVATEKEKVWYHKCPSRGKNCQPWPGNTKLTIPYKSDGKLSNPDPQNWILDEGGCTIWYDEPKLHGLVEKRIGMPLKIMNKDDFSIENLLPSPLTGDELAAVRAGGANSNGNGGAKSDDGAQKKNKDLEKSRRAKQIAQASVGIVYGQKKDELSAAQSKKVVGELSSCVSELSNLERFIQQHFLSAANKQHVAPNVAPNLVNQMGGLALDPEASAFTKQKIIKERLGNILITTTKLEIDGSTDTGVSGNANNPFGESKMDVDFDNHAVESNGPSSNVQGAFAKSKAPAVSRGDSKHGIMRAPEAEAQPAHVGVPDLKRSSPSGEHEGAPEPKKPVTSWANNAQKPKRRARW